MKIDKLISHAKAGGAGIDIVAKERLETSYGACMFDFFPTVVSGPCPDPTGGDCNPQEGGSSATTPITGHSIGSWVGTHTVGSGQVAFYGFTPAQLQNFAIIPEDGTQMSYPSGEGLYKGVDGFYIKPSSMTGGATSALGRAMSTSWYKIPDGMMVIVTPGTSGTGMPNITVVESESLGVTSGWQSTLTAGHDSDGNPFNSSAATNKINTIQPCCQIDYQNYLDYPYP